MGGSSSDSVSGISLDHLRKALAEANDRGWERSQEVQQAARAKAVQDRQRRKALIVDQHFGELPKLFEDAVALGQETFEFYPVSFSEVTDNGLGLYNPKPDSNADLVMEVLKELDLIADIEGSKGGSRGAADAYVVVQSKLFG